MPRPDAVFVLVDALGWKYVEGRDFLCDVLPYRQPLRTVLGYSSGAIPCILTGQPPSRTGHWNLFYYNPAGSPFRWLRPFTVLPDAVLNRRVTRKLLKEAGRRALGLGPLFECSVAPRYLPFFDWVEKKNIYAPGGIGGAMSIFDHCERAGVPYRAYSYHTGSDAALLERARRDLAAGAASFYFIYLCEMDHLLHMHCKEPDRIGKALEHYAEEIGEVFRIASEANPRVRLALASDHGMTPVEGYHDLMSGIEGLGLAMPDDYLAVYDSTMARFWSFNEQARRAITGRLEGEARGRILSGEELRELGVYFEDGRFGELVFLLNPGLLLARSGFNGPRWNPAGMHGYHPGDPWSDGVFLAGTRPEDPLNGIADLFGWMREASHCG